MSPDEAAANIRDAARSFVREANVHDLWSSFHSALADLCRDEPLQGRFLDLFLALEKWEESVEPERTAARDELRRIAARLAPN
jgi:hypothetical protein